MTVKKLVLTVVGLVLTIVLSGCPNPTDNQIPKRLTVGYLSGLMVDIGDAAALGIAKKSIQQTRNIRAAAGVTYTGEKNYLVKTTTDISHGNVEWNESGLTNVTFMKRTTETIVIPIYDGEGNIIGEEEIKEEQTITQDEIPAQVNKLYAYNTYTFIQFVPVETTGIGDVRPNDLGTQGKDGYYDDNILKYLHDLEETQGDKDGYYDYDKRDYYNDDFHQSFVIENKTGNIYSLADAVHIDYIHNGLLKLKDSPYIWDCRIKANDELEIFSLFQNTAVDVYDYYKDKHGNNYISNSSLDLTDTQTNTIFHKRREYHLARNTGEVVYVDVPFDYNAYYGYSSYHSKISQIKIMDANCTPRDITESDYIEFFRFESEFRPGIEMGDKNFSHIKNKEMFIYVGDACRLILDTDTAAVKKSAWFENATYSRNAFLYDTVLIESDSNLYYYKVNFDALPATGVRQVFTNSLDGRWLDPNYEYHLYGNDLIPLLKGYDDNEEYSYMLWFVKSWIVTTINSRDEYIIVIKEVNGKKVPEAVKISEYVAEEQQVITLKPINR